MINSSSVQRARSMKQSGQASGGPSNNGNGGTNGQNQQAPSSKQVMEQEKKNNELHQHNTTILNELFMKKLAIDGLDQEVDDENVEPNQQQGFDEDRHSALYWCINQLSSQKMSVFQIHKLLEIIFWLKGVEKGPSEEVKHEILKEKFKFVGDLARSCKLSVQELLMYSPKKIYAKITQTILIDENSLQLIDVYIGLDFFKNTILPQSWFHLIKDYQLDRQKLQKMLKEVKWKQDQLIKDTDLKRGLHYCIAQTAISQKLSYKEKKQMLDKICDVFEIHRDSEKEKDQLYQLYKASWKQNNVFFESKVLENIIKKLGMGKKYLLEDLLYKNDPSRVLLFYQKNHYINQEFFQKQTTNKEPIKSYEIVINALNFLNQELKKNTKLDQSDFSICFLECFEQYLKPLERKQNEIVSGHPPVDQLQKQNILMQFIRIVEIIFKNGLCDNENFKVAIIYQVIYVLKLGIEDQDIVDMSIYSLQILLNAIGITSTIRHLDRFFSIAVNAFLKYSSMRRIKNYTKRIFEFYIKDKVNYSREKFRDFQFIFLNQIKGNQHMREPVEIVANELYDTEAKIAQNLVYHVKNLKNQSEDIKILGVKYILEILECKNGEDKIRKKLVEQKVLKIVYMNVVALKQDYKTEKSIELSVLCGKVIAAIGLQHAFVNDELSLKATNQKTMVHQQNPADLEAGDEKKFEINVKSDYYNPISNIAGGKNSCKRDDTLEQIAIPNLTRIYVEREDEVKLAHQILTQIMEISNLADDLPKNYFFSQFLLINYLNDRKIQKAHNRQSINEAGENQHEITPEQLEKFELNGAKYKQLQPAVIRYTHHDDSKYLQLSFDPKKNKVLINQLCFFLINQIEDPEYRKIFSACIPGIKQSVDIRNMLLPYLVYFAMRFNNLGGRTQSGQADGQIAEDVSYAKSLPPDILNKQIETFFNDILKSQFQEMIDLVLKTLDFLNVCLEQDKLKFKDFIEEETKFKYVERLFMLEIDETKSNDQNIQSFIKTLKRFPVIRLSFLAVQKINKLKQGIDRDARFKGAQKIKNFKRCIFNFEENFRRELIKQGNQGKDFLSILSNQETIEVVDLYRKINLQNFDSDFFTNIIKSDMTQVIKAQHQHQQKTNSGNLQVGQKMIDMQTDPFEDQAMLHEKLLALYHRIIQTNDHSLISQFEKLREKYIHNRFIILIKQVRVIQDLWDRNWRSLSEWLGDFDIADIKQDNIWFMIQNGFESKQTTFEMILCFIFAEYYRGLQFLLKSDETMEDKNYLNSLQKIQNLLRILYHNFTLYLTEEKESSYDLKLFLHVIYEIDCSMHFLKDVLFSMKDSISTVMCGDVNKDRRKFEKIYYDHDMKVQFEYLLTWFEERTELNTHSITSHQALMLIYQVRKLIFSLYDRENEQAYYMMRIAKIERKRDKIDILKVNQLFQECSKFQHKIIDYEYEYAKYLLRSKNAHDAYQYLVREIDEIKKKCDRMYKETKVVWLPDRICEKAQLLIIELQIKIDQRNAKILTQFTKYVKDIGKNKWEKPFFKFGQYLDMLDTPPCGITQPLVNLTDDEKKKRLIQKIFYYIKSLEDGHKYIWQSLPRALQLWFEYKEDGQDDSKIQIFMRQELQKLDKFKLATALQILLSRYGHPNSKVRETIQIVLANLACEYPGQCAWWIFHFLYFDEKAGNNKKQSITRGDFAKEVLNKITAQNKEASKKILEGEKIFFELKKLSEKQPVKNTDNIMDMPNSLQRISKSHLVMPIEENLSVQLPAKNYMKQTQLTSLVSTTKTSITSYNKDNVDMKEFLDRQQKKSEALANPSLCQVVFHAYKEDPVMISSFQTKVTIMHSKEKPKKIGIVGSNGQNYNFLLKCDKYGDLRKEQRFIDFAVLCNKILESDAEARKRNLRLRTYAIVPLSRNTGLIEWIQNTQTLKSVVGDYWKKNNIKGEMQDIKKKAQDNNLGENHTNIWHILKVEMRPVLGNWLQDHFPNPEIWYEAQQNFIKSTAIWSMIGYIIGLGDRHGDNILIHSHTGEVTHVDFDCIFEKGAKLRVPEIVPFRLTPNIVDAFGIFQDKGVFQKSCEIVLRVLRKNSPNIRSFLYSFIHDPLIEASNNVKVEIKDGLATVSKKLNGQISNEEGAEASVTVEAQVEQVILNAINDESLKQMYIGWMPWL